MKLKVAGSSMQLQIHFCHSGRIKINTDQTVSNMGPLVLSQGRLVLTLAEQCKTQTDAHRRCSVHPIHPILVFYEHRGSTGDLVHELNRTIY